MPGRPQLPPHSDPKIQRDRNYSARWRLEHRHQKLQTCRRAKWRRSGIQITEEEYQQRIKEQGGLCAICQKTMRPPGVDHVHPRGTVRGLLCVNCNLALGHLKDSVENCTRAAIYLARNNFKESINVPAA